MATANPGNPHIDALSARHAQIEGLIAAEMLRPVPDSVTLARLKRQKLKLKEEVVGFARTG
jgi:hypothetical protein